MKSLLNKILCLPFSLSFFKDAQDRIFAKHVMDTAQPTASSYDVVTWKDQPDGTAIQTRYTATLIKRVDLIGPHGGLTPRPE